MTYWTPDPPHDAPDFRTDFYSETYHVTASVKYDGCIEFYWREDFAHICDLDTWIAMMVELKQAATDHFQQYRKTSEFHSDAWDTPEQKAAWDAYSEIVKAAVRLSEHGIYLYGKPLAMPE